MAEKSTKAKRSPNKLEAVLPIAVLLIIMILNYVLGWGQDAHIPCLIAIVIAFAFICMQII